MPEGPEVYITTYKLRNKILGKQLIAINFIDSSKYPQTQDRYRKYLLPYLAQPTIVADVFCKAKYIFIKLQNQSGIIYLHSHLNMTGRWSWVQSDYSRLSLSLIDPSSQLNLNSSSQTNSSPQPNSSSQPNTNLSPPINSSPQPFQVYFDDIRKFGKFEIYSEREVTKVLNDLGPDILSDILDIQTWWQHLSNRGKNMNKNICTILMDQAYISGIGNYLKSEILYYARIRPDHSLKELNQEQIQALWYYSYTIPRLSLQSGGLTISDFKDPDNMDGTFRKVVYKNKVDPYGYPILTLATSDGRKTYWVKEVQY